jgi:hypothetical protein
VIISIFALFNLVFAPFFSDEGYSLTVNIRVFGLEPSSYSRETLQVEKDFCGCLEVYPQKEQASPIWRCRRLSGDVIEQTTGYTRLRDDRKDFSHRPEGLELSKYLPGGIAG